MACSPSARAAASSRSTFTSQSSTLAPASTKAVAIALPIPDAAPVTTAPLPFSSSDISSEPLLNQAVEGVQARHEQVLATLDRDEGREVENERSPGPGHRHE